MRTALAPQPSWGWRVGGGAHQAQLPSRRSSADTRANTTVHRWRSTGQQRTHGCRGMQATCEPAPRRNQHSRGPMTWGPGRPKVHGLPPPPSRRGATAPGPRPQSSQNLLHMHAHGTHHPSFLEWPPTPATAQVENNHRTKAGMDEPRISSFQPLLSHSWWEQVQVEHGYLVFAVSLLFHNSKIMCTLQYFSGVILVIPRGS